MRILHTADWHLGKKLDFFNRLEEQRAVLNEMVQIAEEQKVDMVIVAGDLFDTFNPPNEATELLYKTLKKLAKNGKVPVIAIAGNHDSPDRVNVADVLARENGIVFIGNPNDKVAEFELEDGFKVEKSEIGFVQFRLPQLDYPVRLIHTAFASEQRLKEYFGEDKQRSLQESLGSRWQSLATEFCDENGVNLLTTHLYMLKRGGEKLEEPDGEKPLNIGNADVVYSDAIPAQIQYVALGHLHSYQDVGAKQPVIYSSAILQYSFAEAGQKKYISILDIEPNQEVKLEKIELKAGKQLVRKTFTSVDDAVEWLGQNQDCLLELTLESDTFLKAEDRKRIYQTHSGIIYLIPKVKMIEDATRKEVEELNLSKDVSTLFVDYFKSKNIGQEPNEEIMTLLKEVLGNK